MSMPTATDPILQIRGLSVGFPTRAGTVIAVDDASLSIGKRETFGLIGETGSGKSVLGMAVMRLLPNSAHIGGTIMLEGIDILTLDPEATRKLRGGSIGLVPQNPGSSLNPVLRVGFQIGESVRLHRGVSGREAGHVVHDLLHRMGLPEPEKTARQYPFQLSGGMRQRVLTAIGIAGQPSLLIADEPTKGLDAIIRGQVIETLYKAARETKASMLVITHDLQVAEQLCDRVGVMYAGKILEIQTAERLFSDPKHPYTKALLNATPRNGLVPLPGIAPGLFDQPTGCVFAPRCGLVEIACGDDQAMRGADSGVQVRCRLHAC